MAAFNPPAQAGCAESMGPNGKRCYVNDTMLADGRPISAHCMMAVLCERDDDGVLADPAQQLEFLKTLVDPLTDEQADQLMSIDHWSGFISLLDAAVVVGHVPTMEYLIEKGADVHGKNGNIGARAATSRHVRL
mmetsp:Transcript_97804/g.279725  ORF Transcript_97804/g.279725 Transcript_97804/m.279725 type:complete len:134 (+) Transcript_97804:168-569(+)